MYIRPHINRCNWGKIRWLMNSAATEVSDKNSLVLSVGSEAGVANKETKREPRKKIEDSSKG